MSSKLFLVGLANTLLAITTLINAPSSQAQSAVGSVSFTGATGFSPGGTAAVGSGASVATSPNGVNNSNFNSFTNAIPSAANATTNGFSSTGGGLTSNVQSGAGVAVSPNSASGGANASGGNNGNGFTSIGTNTGALSAPGSSVVPGISGANAFGGAITFGLKF
jgi:hypothetical protein